MKDPLQPPTPYEVLDVRREASERDVHRAFKIAVARRAAPVAELQRARTRLNDPIERGLLDLFTYSDEQVRQLDPNPVDAPIALAVEHRFDTVKRWEDVLRTAFPNLARAHALGVLWYWSARSGLDAEEAAADWRTLRDRWRAAIAYWTHLLARPDSLRTLDVLQHDLTHAQLDEVRRRARDEWVEGPLRTASGAEARWPASFRAMYRECLLDSDLERRCAAAMDAVALRNSRGRMACGPLLLYRVGHLQRTRNLLDQRVGAGGVQADLLRLYLSSYGRAKALVEAGRPEAAVEALERPGGAASEDHRNLYAEAQAALATKRADVGNYPEALALWRDALGAVASASRRREMQRAVKDAAETRARNQRARDISDRESAISTVERALEIVPEDEDLKRMLAADLLSRARVRADHGDMPGARRDVERAADLGSPEAARLLGRETATERPTRSAGIPPSAQRRAEQAQACAKRQDWEGARTHIDAAIAEVGARSAPPAWRLLFLFATAAVARQSEAHGREPRSQERRREPPARPDRPARKKRPPTSTRRPRGADDATGASVALAFQLVLLTIAVWLLLRFG